MRKKEKEGRSCLIHFLDILDNIFVSNGALITINKVLTTRDFLEQYKNDTCTKNLFACPSKLKDKKKIKNVVKVIIESGASGKFGVACVSSFT